MARARKPSMPDPVIVPMLKTVEQMSQYSGIGINRLRQLINDGEIEYVRNGNRYLLADRAIWDWYERNKVKPKDNIEEENDHVSNSTTGKEQESC